MKMTSTHLDGLIEDIKKTDIVKKKRERAVLHGSGLFYKIWVPNWTQGAITKHCFDSGFYDAYNTESIVTLIHDDTGPRGYVQKSGQPVATAHRKNDNEWTYFTKLVDKKTRFDFVLDLMKKSVATDGTFSDFAPSNIIMYNDKPNLIDLESYRSFDLVLDRKKAPFETFDLDAWWKPHETALRDVNAYFKSYFKVCLDIRLDFDISDRAHFNKALEIAKDAYTREEV